MPETHSTKRNWTAESVRFTAFPTGPLELSSATEWWHSIIGRAPEALTVRQGAAVEAVGPIDRGNLGLVFSAFGELRLDLILSPPVPVKPEFQSLGEAKDAVEALSDVVEKWFQLGIPTRRLALGGVVHSDAASVTDGYNGLSELLPAVKLDSEGSSEFLYQINRPRPSHTAEVAINRLSKWAVAARHHLTFSFALSGQATVPGSMALATPSAMSIRLEFDINTSPTHTGAFSPDVLEPLLRELVTLAEEVWSKGDRP